MIPDSFLEELKQRCDIESLISSYVLLKRAGRNLKGLCPFHSEKTPSFVVYPEGQSLPLLRLWGWRRCHQLYHAGRKPRVHRSGEAAGRKGGAPHAGEHRRGSHRQAPDAHPGDEPGGGAVSFTSAW